MKRRTRWAVVIACLLPLVLLCGCPSPSASTSNPAVTQPPPSGIPTTIENIRHLGANVYEWRARYDGTDTMINDFSNDLAEFLKTHPDLKVAREEIIKREEFRSNTALYLGNPTVIHIIMRVPYNEK